VRSERVTATPATSEVPALEKTRQARLEAQGRIADPATRMIFAHAGIRPGMRVLDLDCRPGTRLSWPPIWWEPAACSRRTLVGRKTERFGMGPPVVPGQGFAEGTGAVGHGPLAELAAGDRELGDGDRETA
jgi:hypothetical protein